MGYKQPNNPMKMMKSALKMHKAEKKAGMHRDSAMYMNHSAMNMGHSPMEMGHSPMEMGHSPMEMGHESPAKKYDSPMNKESRELKDMPIVDIEKGDAKGSPAKADKPISEHFSGNKEMQAIHSKQAHHKSGNFSSNHPGHSEEEIKKILKSDERKGSPAKAAKPDYIDIDGDGDKNESMKEAAKDKKKGSPAKKFDRVVFGGNKGDKSKTKPGKKDFEKKGSPAKKDKKMAKLEKTVEAKPKRKELKKVKIAKLKKKEGSPAKKYDRVVLGGNKGDKSKTKPGKKDYEK